MASLKTLCDKGLYLENGSKVYSGNINDSIKTYLDSNVSLISNCIYEYPLFDDILLEQFSLNSYSYYLGDDVLFELSIRAENISINNLCLYI